MNIQKDGKTELVDASDHVGDEHRRQFLKSAGKFAVVVPPTMTLLLSTTMSSPAIAKSGSGVTPGDENPGGGNPGGGNPGGGNPGGGKPGDGNPGGGNPGGGTPGGGNPGVSGGYGPGSVRFGGGGVGGSGFGPGGAPGSHAVLGAPNPPVDAVRLANAPGLAAPEVGHPPSITDAILSAGERG